MTIGINERVNVMTMVGIPREEIENAEWLVTSGDITRNEDGEPFIVKYPCAGLSKNCNHNLNPGIHL